MTVIRGWDQSWGFADPATAARLGFKVVSGYLSHDTGKNLTAADVKAYHKHGIAVLLNWESEPGRPLLGRQAGLDDAHDALELAVALIHAVGYAPPNKLGTYFSCDRDTTPADYPKADAYYAATASLVRPRFLNGCYGEFDLVNHLHAKGLTDVEWQTLAWSYGKVSPEADFYQSSINERLGGASVDFDEVLHALTLGAWWPPGLEPKYPPTHQNWSDTVDQKTVQKLIDQSVDRHLRAAVFGGDAELNKLAPGLYPDADHGLTDRLRAVEAKVKP
jgi:hypothetical protein